MGVIEIERMRQGTVEEGGARRGIARGIAEYAGIPGSQAERASRGEQGRGALGIMARPHDVADKIEQQEPRPRDHLGWQGVERDGGTVVR